MMKEFCHRVFLVPTWPSNNRTSVAMASKETWSTMTPPSTIVPELMDWANTMASETIILIPFNNLKRTCLSSKPQRWSTTSSIILYPIFFRKIFFPPIQWKVIFESKVKVKEVNFVNTSFLVIKNTNVIYLVQNL